MDLYQDARLPLSTESFIYATLYRNPQHKTLMNFRTAATYREVMFLASSKTPSSIVTIALSLIALQAIKTFLLSWSRSCDKKLTGHAGRGCLEMCRCIGGLVYCLKGIWKKKNWTNLYSIPKRFTTFLKSVRIYVFWQPLSVSVNSVTVAITVVAKVRPPGGNSPSTTTAQRG